MGRAALNGDKIKFGPLAGTKMMCDLGASDQETAYLKALENAQRFEVKDAEAADLRCRLGCARVFML